MEIKIEFNLLQTGSDGALQSVRNGLPSIQAAKDFAQSWAGRETQEFKIQRVVTIRSIEEILTVPAMTPPTLDEIAANLSTIYCSSIDWEDEDYLALSPEDQEKVRDIVNQETDVCESCGWTFESGYLSPTDYGNICDSCETEHKEEEEQDEG